MPPTHERRRNFLARRLLSKVAIQNPTEKASEKVTVKMSISNSSAAFSMTFWKVIESPPAPVCVPPRCFIVRPMRQAMLCHFPENRHSSPSLPHHHPSSWPRPPQFIATLPPVVPCNTPHFGDLGPGGRPMTLQHATAVHQTTDRGLASCL